MRRVGFGAPRERRPVHRDGLAVEHGELHTRLEDGRSVVVRPGMSYQGADDAVPHRSSTASAARVFVVE